MMNNTRIILYGLAALMLLLMGVSIRRVYQKYKTHQMIITDAGGIPPGSIWYGWVSDSDTADVNYCYYSGSQFEEYLMVRVLSKKYSVMKRNLKTNYKMNRTVEKYKFRNENVLEAIGSWWDPARLSKLSFFAPSDKSSARDRIIFDDSHYTIYFFSIRPQGFSK